jgi:putative MATE family efflux protein
MLIGLIPYAISQAYASTMRETGQTFVPMIASSTAVATNFILNAVLIFGLLGAPAMGVAGAAIATVISRFLELGILVFWGHTHKKKCPYLKGAFRSLYIPRSLFGRITVKGMPLMANEFFWAIAITLRNQGYSTCGIDVVAAQNIAVTIINLFSVVYMSLGSAIAILVGNQLGAGEIERARDTDRKMIAFSVFCSVAIGALLVALSPLFPRIYNTTDEVRALAAYMIAVYGCLMPFASYACSAYFTLRSGGKVLITFVFDSVFMWALTVPLALALTELTSLSIYVIFPLCQGLDVVKCLLGFLFLRRKTWVRRLVADGE